MNVIAPEVPPPGMRVNTVTWTVLGVVPPDPAVKTSAAGIVASSCVALT